MKGARMTKEQLKACAAASINQEVIAELEKPAKKKDRPKLPKEDAPQVLWLWGQLVGWSLATGIFVKREHRFDDKRLWRFDFALPDYKIGIEYEGLNSEKSGHTTLKGYTKDTEKYNQAQALGWKVIRFTCKNYKTVIKELEKQLNECQGKTAI
jgi:very-short-patch-repair endonuclease